jgi:lipoprotein-anchoring transpeptidase ErfK/SrfK
MRVSRRRISTRTISTERFWQIAILTAASTIGAISHADAALYYWQDSDPGFYRPAPTVQPRRQRTHRGSTGKTAAATKETGTKPQGPLIIAVSIDKQRVRIFDDNGVFAEAPVSTGMPGHPTPTGVFSVIQKHKFHHSNIYSGAPMPYMQRITWSGIALHAGPLPGYPASHGCIRLPQDFAIRLWGTTKVGARVIVTREPAAPVEIANPNLFLPKKAEEKVLPAASAAEPTDSAELLAADLPGTARPIAATAMTQATGSIAATPIEARPVSEPPRQKGSVSVFVSRKQNRLFVRQGFVPLFDLPLTIAAPDRPLGTHVFTAMALKDDGTAMRWTVVSIPSAYPQQIDRARKRIKKTPHDRRETPVAVAAPQAVSTAAEALDRIKFPPEAIEQISTLLSPGASLIVSDNALSDETDSDTDFIVLTQ